MIGRVKVVIPAITAVSLGALCMWHSARAADTWTLQSAFDLPSELKVAGSVRGRYEALDGQPRVGLGSSPDLFSFRTTLLAEYNAGFMRVGAEMYDSRTYWSEADSGVSTNEVNALELVQAYVGASFNDVVGAKSVLAVQAGRFTMNLGSRRLVAADDYRNTTNGYTGLRADLKLSGGTNGTLFYTLPQRRLPDDMPSILDNDIAFDSESSDLALWGGYLTIPKVLGGASVEGAFVALDENDQNDLPTRNRQLHTVSARAFQDPAPGRWDFDFEGAYQDGTIRASSAASAAELDVKAFFYHLEVGYQATDPWRTHVALEYDHVSGDDSDTDYGRFDTLYGMRRGDFAPSGIYAAVGRANIQASGLRVEVAPTPQFDAMLNYKALWLESATDSFSTTGVRDAAGRAGDFAGHQVDMRARYWLVPKMLRFEADVVLLFKGRFMEDAANAPQTGDTHYVSLNLTASI